MTQVRLINCNPSDDAEACGLPQSLTARDHDADMSDALRDAIAAARVAMAGLPLIVSVHLDARGLISSSMEEGLNEADTWRDGTDCIIVYRRAGVFTRLTHDDNRQAEIEFEIVQPDGKPL